MRRRHLLTAAPLIAAAAACTPRDEGAGSSPSATTPGGSGGSDHGGASDRGGASDGGGSPAPKPQTTRGDFPRASEIAQGRPLDEVASQLVMVGVPAPGPAPRRTLTDHRPGGIFLLGVWKERDDVVRALDSARDAMGSGIAPLFSVDQEGGQVRMLRGSAARKSPSARAMGDEGPDAVRRWYGEIAQDLAMMGIHLDLAPVADVVDPDLGRDNAPVGRLDRGFGTDADAVADCVEAAVAALAAKKVDSALKHFPGLGRIRENTDHSDRGISDSLTTPDDPFLEPFRRGIGAWAPAVMISSALYPKIDGSSPAMFSRAVITDLLRRGLGFQGAVISDDVGAAAAVKGVPVGERATRFLEAGGDVLLTADPRHTGTLIDAIRAWGAQSKENEERVRDAARHMLALKERAGLLG